MFAIRLKSMLLLSIYWL